MAKWTEERKRKRAEAIRRWKPWEKSTGPKTKEGKTRVSLNAFKDGNHSLFKREMLYLLKINRQFIRQYNKLVIAPMIMLCEESGLPYKQAAKNKLIKRQLNQRGRPPPPDRN